MYIEDSIKRKLDNLVSQGANSFKAFSYQKLTVDGTVRNLTVPADAKYALLTFESDATGITARYLETKQTTVDANTGLALSNLDRFDITDYQNLTQFQIVQTGAGTHTLHIQYYR